MLVFYSYFTIYMFPFMIYTGGGTLTISGYGFKDGATVTVGTGECEVLSVDPDEILCVIPSLVSYTYLSTIEMSYIADIIFSPLPLGKFFCFFFSKSTFLKTSFRNRTRVCMSKQFGSR